MIRVVVYDLRHYDRQKPTYDMPEEIAQKIKDGQPPTDYGLIATVCAARLLEKQGVVPDYRLTSPQNRAERMDAIMGMTNAWEASTYPLPELNDLSSDPNFDKPRLKEENKGSGVSIEETALTTQWAKEYVFLRATKALAAIGPWLLEHAADGNTVVMTSHGASTEMRYMMMKLLNQLSTPLAEQRVDMFDVSQVPNGVFDTCEGGVYEIEIDDDSGVIIACHSIDTFRLPDEVKALKAIFK